MKTPRDIINILEATLKEYKKPVTELSKTGEENPFITNDTIMFDWDSISKLQYGDDSSSVDAIYYTIEDNEVTLYFFEFKNLNMYETVFDARKQLENCITDLEQCEFNCKYPQKIRKIKKGLISKKLVSLKTKPLESLILLHKILHDEGIKPEEIVNIRKEYYIISNTPIKKNKSNYMQRGRTGEILGFVNKIQPFPFINVEPITKTTFLSLLDDLKRKNELNN